jgi:hypothetical protein
LQVSIIDKLLIDWWGWALFCSNDSAVPRKSILLSMCYALALATVVLLGKDGVLPSTMMDVFS